MAYDWGQLKIREKQYWLPLLFTPSYVQDADALIYSGACLLGVVRVNTNAVADATVTVFDALDGSDATTRVEIYPISGTADYGGISFGIGAGKMDTGIYCTVTGAGALYWVWYAEIQ